jgi:hypothetical protein
MTDESMPPPAPGSAPRRRRRFKARELNLADGSKLVLNQDGSIDRMGQEGTTATSWAPGDPGWAHYAIRFGLRPEPPPVNPHNRRTGSARP